MPNELAYDPNLADNALVQPNGSPYQQPASYEDALQHLYSLTGIPDLLSAYQAANRGEYLPALGQGAAAGAAMLPALKPFALAPLALAMKGAKGGENALLGALPEVNKLMPIRAYHGSPYDFDAFDASKIGTGEGAQAYGHGLYFAEHPEVAKDYKTKLSAPEVSISGPLKEDNNLVTSTVHEALYRANGDVSQAIDWIRSKGKPRDFINNKAIEWLTDPENRQYFNVNPGSGKMYEVNINANPDTFLHWDKPLSDQPETVKQALESTEYPYHAERLVGSNWMEKLTGSDLINKLAGDHASASDALRAAGINGIKYLDQGSRLPKLTVEGQPYDMTNPAHLAAGQLDTAGGDVNSAIYNLGNLYNGGANLPALLAKKMIERGDKIPKLEKVSSEDPTHNYVVFDPKIIEIIKKYGLAALIGGGASAVSGNADAATHLIPVDHDPFEDK